MKVISSIEEISDCYDAVFCDVWGVIHDGRRCFPAAAEALRRLRQQGRIVILLTNVPKPRGPIPAQLQRLGFPDDAYDAIVTSGDATRAELAARAPGPMLKIGPGEYDRSLWEGLGLIESALEEARFIGISGLYRDDETPADYTDILREAKARDLEMVCANPDIVVRVADRLIWCAGAVARDYANMGGRVIMAGKPHAPIYALAHRELEALTGRVVEHARILCIGDGVGTDVAGANAQGLDSLFIASGMHGEALWSEGRLDAAKVEAALAAEDARASYVMTALA